MAKLKRGAYMTFVSVDDGTSWYLIGKHIDDMSVAMNGSFETNKNILDESYVTDEGYSPSIEATPYYADPEDDIYDWIRNVAMNRLSGDDCKASYMEVTVDSSSDTSHKAWTEDCYIEIGDYGGDTTGFQIPFTIHPAGNRVEGTVTLTSAKVPTFTEGSAL